MGRSCHPIYMDESNAVYQWVWARQPAPQTGGVQ